MTQYEGQLAEKQIIVPVLRNLLVKPSLTSVGFGITCGLGYFLLNPYPVNAKDKPMAKSDSYERTELPLHVVVGRVFSFWKKVAPIIIHYKFATMWMKRIKDYDRPRRDEIYDSLHQRYAPEAKEVASELKGEFCEKEPTPKKYFPIHN